MADWVAANQVPELLFGAPATVGAIAAPPQPAPGLPYAQAPQTNGMALASMILGIVSFILGTMIVTGIPAVICGHIARRQIRENPQAQTGDGMALTGLVTGYLSIILSVVLIAFLIIFFVFIFNEVSTMSPGGAPSTTTPVSPPSFPTPAPAPGPGTP